MLAQGANLKLTRKRTAQSMSGMSAISTTSRLELSSGFIFFLQGKAPKEIHVILI
jgi:hypothetical protein